MDAAVRIPSSPRIILVNVTWNIIMTPHKLAGRRSLMSQFVAIVLLALIFVCFAMGVVTIQQHGDLYYAESNDNVNTSIFYNAEKSRIENGRFILKPRNPDTNALNGQYYFTRDSMQKRDLSTYDHKKGHSLDWGYEEFMNHLKTKPKCASSAFLLVLITSAPDNADRRTAIRNSWCSNNAKSSVRHTQTHAQTSQLSWHCTFLVGRDRNAVTNAKVLKESQYFSDILYGDYDDSYRNLSFKVLAGLHWAHLHCPLQFVLKTDDDCFVNIHLLPEFLLNQQVDQSVLYAGNAADQERRAHVIRDPGNKWSVTREEYAPDLYPPYASGTGYILSQNVLSRMLELSHYYKPFPNEDAYIGVLADQLALSPIHSSRFTLYSDAWTICNYRYLLVIHHVSVEQQAHMQNISSRAVDECKDQKFIKDWN